MSEVNDEGGVEGERCGEGPQLVVTTGTPVSKSPPVSVIVAPALRVEELKDTNVPCVTTSDEESALSHGEASGGSDFEGGTSPNSKDGHLPEFQPPEEELKNKIIKQVEFYFSDANILKDAFLLKHVRRNKQGFVSLKLITSFRKMKSLTKDYRVVAYSLRQSDLLEVNEEGTKIKRKNPLPEYDETTPSRTVVGINLPIENPTIETVGELFSTYGEVTLMRILRPGKPIPADIKKHINKHPEIGNTICAVVEFENHESAKKACDSMTNTDDWRKGMRVVLLAAQTNKKDKTVKEKKSRNDKEAVKFQEKKEDGQEVVLQNDVANKDKETGKLSPEPQERSTSPYDADMDENWRQKKSQPIQPGAKKRKNHRLKNLAQEGEGSMSSGSEAEPEGMRRHSGAGLAPSRSSLSPQQDPNRLSPSTTPRTTPRSSPRNSPRSSPRGSPNMRRRNLGKSPLAQENPALGTSPRASPAGSPEMRRRGNSAGAADFSTSPSQSPWVQRRLKAQQEASPLAGNSPMASPLMGRRVPESILRQPLGPDDSKGFYGGKGRGKPRSET